MREFGIKHNRYANCCVALVGEMVISLPVLSCSKKHVILSRMHQLTPPSFVFS